MLLELFNRLGLALAIGFLVGVERGWRARDVAEGRRTAGIRTYALTGLLGGVTALLSQALGGWAFVALGLPFAAAFILFKHREQEEEGDYSVTAIVAALLVFALGAYAVIGDGRVAAATAVVATALLAFKGLLHSWLARLTWPELRSALILLAMSLVALPLLPNRGFGPYESVNPYELWLLTIAMAGVSFVAYAAIKIFGPSRGLMLASVAGAVVSSTATTLHLARLNRQAAGAEVLHAAAALLAGAVMAARLGVITAMIAPVLFQRLVLPLGAFAAVSTILALASALGRASKPAAAAAAASDSPMKSPFDLELVLKFALVLGAVMAAARVLSALYGAQGLLPVAALAGLADADAVTLAVARMTTQEGLDLDLAVYAVLLTAAVDSASKATIATVVGGVRFGGLFAAGTLLAAAAATAAFYWGGAPA
ncbi:DUF4010 domain-containing protein [Phenylobacterium sp. LH3H17]|uniref:MgtC/SapB family protein n=1 Tax=Phenylobacterium sp. LH3H17 TaxID=2903901 RepID=UPI0020C969A5|nr:DUF4010 domain-containing protein [Phenylobacterium sp. LH3H17]UTP41122.1 DUF4010 domain-containing protein [Phenylobacterium sp. LH3H17]